LAREFDLTTFFAQIAFEQNAAAKATTPTSLATSFKDIQHHQSAAATALSPSSSSNPTQYKTVFAETIMREAQIADVHWQHELQAHAHNEKLFTGFYFYVDASKILLMTHSHIHFTFKEPEYVKWRAAEAAAVTTQQSFLDSEHVQLLDSTNGGRRKNSTSSSGIGSLTSLSSAESVGSVASIASTLNIKPSPRKTMRKLTFVGDPQTGKTCLLWRFKSDAFPDFVLVLPEEQYVEIIIRVCVVFLVLIFH